ncbi:MAG: glutathione-disulfide reductase [Aestuariivita sp.]|nr:glutathione-disulfide reductase [Aestuariivita sp.]
MTFDYDLFVIGGGSGGVRAARLAAQDTGAKVALAEMNRYGGTCVIRGCVPKKLMVFASEFSKFPEEANAYGWDISLGVFNWKKFSTQLHAELDRLEKVYQNLLTKAGVDMFNARATIISPHKVKLSSGVEKTAKHILIATGGRPVRPEIKNADLGIVSDDIFDLPELPKSVLIVGGGYIACEFACIFRGLGVDVTQFYRGEQILRGFDDQARSLIAEQMQIDGVNLRLGENISEMSRIGIGQDKRIKVIGTTGYKGTFDHVLFATGRRPNSDHLGLEAVGVEIGQKNQIAVDDFSQSSVPSIFAVGDVTNRVNLTPVALREANAFVDTIFKAQKHPMDHALIPSAVFTQPELGTVGLSEEKAREKEVINVYSTSFYPMRTSFAGKSNRAMMKLVISKATQKVLGCTIVAPNAAEMIQFAAIAIKMGTTKADFDRTVAVHPTMSEEIVTMPS